MARKPKTKRVPRTRAGETWTEAAFWGFLRSGVRRMSLRWPPRNAVKRAARRASRSKNKRLKWEYQCAACEAWWPDKEVNMDHIVECGSFKSWAEFGGFCERLFCEIDGWRVLCKKCHKTRHKSLTD